MRFVNLKIPKKWKNGISAAENWISDLKIQIWKLFSKSKTKHEEIEIKNKKRTHVIEQAPGFMPGIDFPGGR